MEIKFWKSLQQMSIFTNLAKAFININHIKKDLNQFKVTLVFFSFERN